MDPEFKISIDDIASDEDLLAEVSEIEKEERSLIKIEARPEQWDRVKKLLLSLRASNISAMVLLKRSPSIKMQEIVSWIEFLRDWDQLFVHNIIELLGSKLSEKLNIELRKEVPIELKWFREWFIASTNTDINKYPGLPWRSYIRKIIGENYQFASELARRISQGATFADIDDLGRQFLADRKQVLCIFPKKWGKQN